LAAFQKAAGFKFKSLEFLNLSFIHRSFSNETDDRVSNERLEFLGDSIVGAVCATLLYKKYSKKSEGELAKIKSVVVSEETLSKIAGVLRLDEMLVLGKGEELSGGRTKKAILADALEALVGALYLDSGFKAAFDFLSRYFSPEIDLAAESGGNRDFKSVLQEACQRAFRCYPEYRLIKRTGPEHDRVFWMDVCINGKSYGPGCGRNKKSAEQEAARFAYEELFNKEG